MVMCLFACAWLARCARLQQVSCRTKCGSPVLCEGLQQRRCAGSQRGVNLQAVCLGSGCMHCMVVPVRCSMGMPMTAGLGREGAAMLSSLLLARGRASSTSWIQTT